MRQQAAGLRRSGARTPPVWSCPGCLSTFTAVAERSHALADVSQKSNFFTSIILCFYDREEPKSRPTLKSNSRPGLVNDDDAFLLRLSRTAADFLSGSWHSFHTRHRARTALWRRSKNADLWTYPLLASVIPPFEVQDELLPHRLVSERREERAGTAQTAGDRRRQNQNKVGSAINCRPCLQPNQRIDRMHWSFLLTEILWSNKNANISPPIV